jgi:hypothetical protein
LKLVGKGVAEEDPNAEGPRTDGDPYQVAEVAKLAVAGRSKWKGKTVKVTGIVRSISTSTGSPPIVTLVDTSDDKATISCTLDAATVKTTSNESITMQGTVEIHEFVRGDGTPGIGADLVNCAMPAKK